MTSSTDPTGTPDAQRGSYVAVLALITLAATFVTPETRGRDLALLGDAMDDTPEQVSARPLAVGA